MYELKCLVLNNPTPFERSLHHLHASVITVCAPDQNSHHVAVLDPPDSPVDHYQYHPLPSLLSPEEGQGVLLSVVLTVLVN